MITEIASRIKYSRLLSGAFWTLLGSGLARLFIVIGSIICANILGAERYGQFGITRSTINLILVLAGLNIGSVITKFVAEYKEKDKQRTTIIILQNYFFVLILSVFLGLFVYLFSEKISYSIIGNNVLSKDIKLSVFILLFGIVFPLNEAIYRGLELYKRLGIIQIFSSLTFIIAVPLGSYYYGVTGAILGYLFYTLISFLTTCIDVYYILKKWQFNLFDIDKTFFDFSKIKSLTIPVFFSSLIEAPFFWYSQVILIKFGSLYQNGIASALLQLRNLILIVPGYVSLVTLPILSKALSNNDKHLYHKSLNQSLKLNFIIALICVAPLIFFPDYFLALFGNDFNSEYLVSFFCYLSVPFLVISNVYNQSIIAKSKGWHNFLISISWNLVLLFCSFLFIKYLKLGVLGYMIALFLAIIFQMLARYIYDRKFNG